MAKRKHQGGGGGGGDARDGGPSSSSKRKFARGGTGSSFIHGPGIFVSCTRGKEQRAASDLVDFLEEIVSRNFAHVEIEEDAGPSEEQAAQEAQRKLAERQLDEDDMDALLNGELQGQGPSTFGNDKAPPRSARAEEKEGKEDNAKAEPSAHVVDDGDVEAQIRAELAELRGQGNEGRASKADGKGKKGPRQKAKGRFRVVDTGMECFRFVSVAKPLDPIALVHHLLCHVERTGSARSRFIQRLTPVSSTHIANEEQLLDVAARELPLYFGGAADDGQGEGEGEGAERGPKTFRVEARIRNHQTLRRDDVIRGVANVISQSCGPHHKADLTKPDLVIVVEIFKSIFGMGVLRDYERFRRYNVLELAKKVSNDVDEDPTSGTASRTAAAAAAAAAGVSGEDKEGAPDGDAHGADEA